MADIAPALLGFGSSEGERLFSDEVLEAKSVVLVVLDGLGMHQMLDNFRWCPTLMSMSSQTITSVVPSTTATALTSISTGVPPGEHGIVGYRIATNEGNLNVLKWETPKGNASARIKPEHFQSLDVFGNQRPPVVSDAKYAHSGLSRAYLRGVRYVGVQKPSCMAVEVRRLLTGGEAFVYVYYDGPDDIAHLHGFGLHYQSELRFCDRLISDLLMEVPRGTAVVVTSDHGLVDCSDTMLTRVASEVLEHASSESGEARFRWLHAKPGRFQFLYNAALENHGHQAWILTIDEIIHNGWLGPVVTDTAISRLGDVAIVARGHHAFWCPSFTYRKKLSNLKGRHGSVTSAEMLVPLLTTVIG